MSATQTSTQSPLRLKDPRDEQVAAAREALAKEQAEHRATRLRLEEQVEALKRRHREELTELARERSWFAPILRWAFMVVWIAALIGVAVVPAWLLYLRLAPRETLLFSALCVPLGALFYEVMKPERSEKRD